MKQYLNFNLDDSGKIAPNERYCIYAGIVFFSKKEYDRFVTLYKSVVLDTQCSYCGQHALSCDHTCPELKSYNLKPKDMRRFMNLINRHFTVGCIIRNGGLKDYVKADAASKRRFTDYAIKRLIKRTINRLIKSGQVNPNEPVRLILNIDQQSTKSSGYYELDEGIKEELIHGVYNFNYGTYHEPILFGELDVHLTYRKSHESYAVQAADLVAGTIRRNLLSENGQGDNEFVTVRIHLP